jgi:hypothetical protein
LFGGNETLFGKEYVDERVRLKYRKPKCISPKFRKLCLDKATNILLSTLWFSKQCFLSTIWPKKSRQFSDKVAIAIEKVGLQIFQSFG